MLEVPRMKLTLALALAAVLALLSITPTPVQAGFPSAGCPINYGPTTYNQEGQSIFPFLPTLVNSPLHTAASKRDKNDDLIVCQKFGGPGPQFVDNTGEG
jgi:hypothetical protein